MRRIALDPHMQGQVSTPEVHAALRRSRKLVEVRSNGRHTVYVGPTGSVPVSNHPGDMPRGTFRSIVRLAIAAGLAILAVIWVIL